MFSTPKARLWVCVTRFSQDTWEQHQRWQQSTQQDEIVYATPRPIGPKIPRGDWVYLLEMNNDYNRIEGIALIQNNIWKMRVPIFHTQNYNRYSYKTKWYKSIDDMTDDELETIKLLEQCVFKGKTHVKRGTGISLFPSILYLRHRKQFTEFFLNLFLEYEEEIPCF